MASLAFINISNKYYDSLRFKYVRQQLAEDKAKIDMIKLPYLSYAASDTAYFWYNDTEDDSLLESDDGTTEFYMNAIKKYHHIEGIDEKTVVLISVYDFNLSEDIGELERRS